MTPETTTIQDTLATTVASLINKTLAGVDKSVAFMQAELPDYIIQLLMWHSVSTSIWFTATLLISSAITGVMIYYMRKGVICGEGMPPCIIITLVAWAAGLAIMSSNMDWFKIWITPKVWLVEYAAGLVK